uniref:Uncharacterized protein n=1 Tax=Alexandrium monilatum TaxID=311494 RepID=A0A7S4VG83_9DINO
MAQGSAVPSVAAQVGRRPVRRRRRVMDLGTPTDGDSSLFMQQDDVGTFARDLNLDVEALSFMRELPADLRVAIQANFDPTGTKDGNVLGRLQAYVRHMMRKNGFQPPEQLTGMRQQAKDQNAAVGMAGGCFHASTVMQPMGGATMPSALTSPPMVLSSGGTAMPAGVATDAVRQFVDQLGLGEPAASLLTRLPEDLQASVIRGFDPSGTKDGNVWGRLLGYIRSLWSRRLGLAEPASTFIRGLPEDVQVAVIADFDASGSKDGNVSARLLQFAGALAARAGPGAGAGAAGAGAGAGAGRPSVGAPPPCPRHAAAGPAFAGSPRAPAQVQTFFAQPPVAQQPLLQESAMGEFAQALGLDASATAFLQSLPEPIQTTVITQFDPSGTKDGNIWGRLFAFVRRLSIKYAGIGQAHVEQIRTLPEEEQRRVILGWTCPVQQQQQQQQQPAIMEGLSLDGGTTEAAIRSFSQLWGLDGRAECFLQALPDAVRQHVVAGFDGSGTKDGNVFGRLLGFARHTWARSLGLDQASVAFIKGLPEEAQMICLTDFDPSGTKDGNVAGRLQGFAKKAIAQAGQLARAPNGGSDHYGGAGVLHHQDLGSSGGARAAAPPPAAAPSLSSDPLVASFLERCGLDASATSYLGSLPEDVLSRVLSEFDPSGTKDGNVLGRLQGYVRFLTARRRRSDDDLGGQAKRQRILGF